MLNYHTLSDSEIMELVIKKDTRAFAILYDRYNGILINYFYKMLWQDREKAQDFMQDFFTKIIEKPKAFDTSRNFKTWMYSVANNMCKNEYRKQGIRQHTSYDLEESQPVQDTHTNIEKTTDESTFKARLDAELNLLEEKQKTTFVLRYFEDMPIKEIAETLDCSEGTVKSRLFYTLKKLNESLKEFAPHLINSLFTFLFLK